jgi:hypothetical protein
VLTVASATVSPLLAKVLIDAMSSEGGLTVLVSSQWPEVN